MDKINKFKSDEMSEYELQLCSEEIATTNYDKRD